VSAPTRNELGRLGETLAAAHLCEAGYRVLARNWRCPRGEIDVVARQDDTLVICEVKTRRSARFGSPAEAVDARKARRLRLLAVLYLRDPAAPLGHPRPAQVRFDVVEVRVDPAGGTELTHLIGAF
jgi:putative endonuclease